MSNQCGSLLDEMAVHSAEIYVRDWAPDLVKKLMAHKDASIRELRAENARLRTSVEVASVQQPCEIALPSTLVTFGAADIVQTSLISRLRHALVIGVPHNRSDR